MRDALFYDEFGSQTYPYCSILLVTRTLWWYRYSKSTLPCTFDANLQLNEGIYERIFSLDERVSVRLTNSSLPKAYIIDLYSTYTQISSSDNHIPVLIFHTIFYFLQLFLATSLSSCALHRAYKVSYTSRWYRFAVNDKYVLLWVRWVVCPQYIAISSLFHYPPRSKTVYWTVIWYFGDAHIFYLQSTSYFPP